MSVFGPNRAGDILVGKTYETEANALAFINSADADSLQVFQEDGTAAVAGEPFKIFQKSTASDSSIEYSEVIDPSKINFIKADAYAAPVSRQLRIEGFSGTVRDNVTYEIWIRLYNDGGTKSVENFRLIPAFYVTPTDASSLTFTDVLNGLKTSLDATLAKEGTPQLFTTSVDTGNGYFIVTGNTQSFVLGKKDGKPAEFDLQAAVRDNGSATVNSGTRYDDLTVATVAEGNPGLGTGTQAANLEWFYKRI